MSHVKSRFVGRVYHSGTTDAVEAVDDKYTRLFVFGLVGREGFGREAFSTPVHCRYFERIDDARFYLYGMERIVYTYAVVKSAPSDTCVDNVFAGCGGGLQWVVHSFPGKLQRIFLLAEADGEIADGQGLHNVFFVMLRADILQDGFVQGAAGRELEIGVMSQTHVRKVLVRENLHDCGRNGG